MRKDELENIIFNGMVALAIFMLVLSYIEENLKIGILTMGYLFFLHLWKKSITLYRYFKKLYEENKKIYIKRGGR